MYSANFQKLNKKCITDFIEAYQQTIVQSNREMNRKTALIVKEKPKHFEQVL